MKKMILTLFILIIVLIGVSYAGSVTLQWDQNNPIPDGYRIYQRVDGAQYSQPVWSGSETTCTIDGLENGKTYYFIVRAYMGTGESPDSNEVSYVVSNLAPPSGLTDEKKDQLDSIEVKLDQILEILGPDQGEGFCGNPTSMIFHKASHWCGDSAIKFDSISAAVAAGYTACGVCKP